MITLLASIENMLFVVVKLESAIVVLRIYKFEYVIDIRLMLTL